MKMRSTFLAMRSCTLPCASLAGKQMVSAGTDLSPLSNSRWRSFIRSGGRIEHGDLDHHRTDVDTDPAGALCVLHPSAPPDGAYHSTATHIGGQNRYGSGCRAAVLHGRSSATPFIRSSGRSSAFPCAGAAPMLP